MLELIFFTSNITKLSHFRHLGKRFGVNINGFKEKTYRASYDEPRIDDREELLRLSYLSALSKWKQSKGFSANSTFFFEDTSVRIAALSQTSEEPGVNIKYWMKGMTFQHLDKILKANGNNRVASVRSDIIIHIPEPWKAVLKIDSDYIWTHGIVHGSITETEFTINTNMVYPWLDSKTFNRWFIPNGTNKPLSLLSIEDADRYDFRSIAFEKAIFSIAKLGILKKEVATGYEQFELEGIAEIPKILIICGPTCAGKTTVAQWLSHDLMLPHIEASDFMYKAFWERHGLRSTVRIGDFAEHALKTEEDIVASPISKHIIEKKYPITLITGFRSPNEIKSLKKHLGSGYFTEIFYIDSDYDIRLKRALIRNRDGITQEKFHNRNLQEERMGLCIIKEELCQTKIKNNGTVDDLKSKLLSLANYAELTSLKHCNVNYHSTLEPIILLALYYAHQNGQWLTTTEIAKLVKSKFKVCKSKNNISRYFNQEYHPYYEVRIRDGKNSIEYQLSATGISAASMVEFSSQTTQLNIKNYSSKLSNPQLKLDF